MQFLAENAYTTEPYFPKVAIQMLFNAGRFPGKQFPEKSITSHLNGPKGNPG